MLLSEVENKMNLAQEHIAILMFVCGHGLRNNAMMAYIERNAYDGAKSNGYFHLQKTRRGSGLCIL